MEKGMIYLSNAFSIQMLDSKIASEFIIKETTLEEIKNETFGGDNYTSVFGHEDIARIANDLMKKHKVGFSCKVNRKTVLLTENDTLYVCQYVGGRLPVGASELPEGSEIKWFKVAVPKRLSKL